MMEDGFDDVDLDLENEMMMEQQQLEEFANIDDYEDVSSTAAVPGSVTPAIRAENFPKNPDEDLSMVYDYPKSVTPVSNETVFQSNFSNPSSFVKKSTNPKTPKELAMIMQQERKQNKELCGNSSIDSKVLNTDSLLITTAPDFSPIPNVKKFLHSRPPDISDFTKDYMTCTLADGTRKYILRRKNQNVEIKKLNEEDTFDMDKPKLLQKSMHELLQEIDELAVFSAMKKPITQLKKNNGLESSKFDELVGKQLSSLWVDKYTPHSFTQLLSPERINREVLKALKKWDHYVFKKPILENSAEKNKSKHSDSQDPRPKQKVILLCGPPGTGKTTLAHIVARHCGYHAIEVNASDDRSPEHLRDLLLRATQNSTINISSNSNEDGENGWNTGTNKPNCIIMDEIDGIDGSRNALDAITSIIKTQLKSVKSTGNTQSFALTRPLICICNDQFAPALRELRKLSEIFVFSPPKEMRLIQRLQQVCQLEGLTAPSAGVLKELCTATGHDIRSALNTLQFAAIRVLQQKQEKEENIDDNKTNLFNTDTSDVLQQGLKDSQVDAFQIWKKTFTTSTTDLNPIKHEKTHKKQNQIQRKFTNSSVEIMELISYYGDEQHVLSGLFDNLDPKKKGNSGITSSVNPVYGFINDSNFLKRSLMAESFSLSDIMTSCCYRLASDGFQLKPYISLPAATINCFYASPQGKKIEFPKKDREVSYRRQQQDNLIKQFRDGVDIHSFCFNSNKTFVLDVLSYLLMSITPTGGKVRTLSTSTLTFNEQSILQEIVKVMESCGLSYRFSNIISEPKTQKYEPNYQHQQPILQLEPNINALLKFSSMEDNENQNSKIPNSLLASDWEEGVYNKQLAVSNEMKQLLNAELHRYSVELKAHKLGSQFDEQMSISPTGSKENHLNNLYNSKKPSSEPNIKVSQPDKKVESLVSSISEHDKKINLILKEDSLGKKRPRNGGLKSFFQATEGTKKLKKDEEDKKLDKSCQKKGVTFRFNQGFSNAVRRLVNIKEFL